VYDGVRAGDHAIWDYSQAGASELYSTGVPTGGLKTTGYRPYNSGSRPIFRVGTVGQHGSNCKELVGVCHRAQGACRNCKRRRIPHDVISRLSTPLYDVLYVLAKFITFHAELFNTTFRKTKSGQRPGSADISSNPNAKYQKLNVLNSYPRSLSFPYPHSSIFIQDIVVSYRLRLRYRAYPPTVLPYLHSTVFI
jgi:hypothetical protein